MNKFDIKAELKALYEQIKTKRILILILPFFLMDAFIRLWAIKVSYLQPLGIFPSILFSAIWVLLIVLIVQNIKGNLGRIVYSLCFLLFFIMYLCHAVYFPYTDFFFSFHLVKSAEEGSSYIWDTVKNTGVLTILSSILVLASGIFAIIKYPKCEKTSPKRILIIIAGFLIIHTITPFFYWRANDTLEWDSWRNPRNVYNNFSDSNKAIKITGLFEYTVRDFYFSFLKGKEKPTNEQSQFLDNNYSDKSVHDKNEYTGILEGKNVIFLQLEGIDDWLLTEEHMPSLYSMMDNSIVFDNHYSFYNGGGSTFNSELATIAGFLTPFSFKENPYSFHENSFPYTLPKLFKERGYTVNAFHMNSGEYYSRELNYLNWGFEKYYSLIDDVGYSDDTYMLDRELIQNELFYEKMFKSDKPFLNYIITYTPHTPFSLEGDTGEILYKTLHGSNTTLPDLSEEEVARLYAGETDKMIELLLGALKDNGLYDNTVIVAYSDHYLYSLNDKTILDKYKNTSNNLINHTPFMIWSADFEKENVSKVNSQIDILPTVLNMFGFEYNDAHYIGKDIMSENYSGYVFFSDYSWYDGVHYVVEGKCQTHSGKNCDNVDELNDEINETITKNDLTLKFDHFRTMSK